MRTDVRTVSSDALRNFWHPVAFAEDVTSTPQQVRLLDQLIAVYRTEGGGLAAVDDLCAHRGTPLSLGTVQGEHLVCAHCGWTYDTNGRCVSMPGVAEESIPDKALVEAYRVTERYGLMWVCLGEPTHPIADFPEHEDPAFRTYYTNTDDWNSSAARLIENFVDTAHFPWVHTGILGSRDRPLVPPITVSQRDGRIEVVLDMDASGGLQAGTKLTHIWDEITLPFTVRQVRTDALGQQNVILLAVSPVTGKSLRRFIQTSRNFALDKPDDVFADQSRLIQSQDKRIVEEQRPEELPVDLAEEMHIRGPDDPAVVYRRALAALGVDAP